MQSPGKPVKPHRTTHARLDPVLPQVGLFRATSDNPRLRRRPDVDGLHSFAQTHDGLTHTLVSPVQLDATDWRHFLTLCALAGLDGQRTPQGESGRGVAPLDTTGIAANRNGIHVRTSIYAALHEAGMQDTGPNRARLRQSLRRLSLVREFLTQGEDEVSGANLLGYAYSASKGELGVTISPQIARTILGESKQHVRVSLEDVRKLADPAAVILHAVLTARLRPGDKRPAVYGLDTLGDLAYGPTDNASTRRNRRPKLREALAQLAALPQWTRYEHDDHVCIWRSDVERRARVTLSDVLIHVEDHKAGIVYDDN